MSASNANIRGFDTPVIAARGGKGGLTHRSDNAEIQYWTGRDIPVEINSEGLLSVYRSWCALSQHGMPRLSATIASDANHAAKDGLLHLKVNNEYLVVSQGADHMRNIGRDMRGLLLSEVNTSVGPILGNLYDQCLARNEAIYARFVSQVSRYNLYWEGLFLPLKGDDGGNSLFVMNYNTPIDNKADILQMMLDRAPVGMIAAVPLDGPRGSLDGRIVSINARAKEILKFDANGSQVHYIHELAPWFRDKMGWDRTAVANEGSKTIFRYRDKNNCNYTVTMEALKRFILFGISEFCEETSLNPPPEKSH